MSAHERNLAATDVELAAIRPYEAIEQHLREELWRIWLRIEYETRRRWELQALPPTQHAGAGPGVWTAAQIGGLFGEAHAEFTGRAIERADHGSRELLDAYLRHSALLELRVERTLAAGLTLPLLELVRIFALDQLQRATLTLALALELDGSLAVALRYLTNDPAVRHVDGRLLALLVYDSVRSRRQLARDLSLRSPLVSYRLLELDESPARHDSVLFRRIRPAARLVPYIGGDRELDPELDAVARLYSPDRPGLFPNELIRLATSAISGDSEVTLILRGQRGIGKQTLVATAAALAEKQLLVIDSAAFAAAGPGTLRGALQGVVREARLLGAVPMFAGLDDVIANGPGSEIPSFVQGLRARWSGPLAVSVHGDRLPALRGPVVHIQMPAPGLLDRAELWRRAIPELDSENAVALSARFAVTGGVIELAARAARVVDGAEPQIATLDAAVRGQLHGRLQRLGKELETRHSFDDLVAEDDTLGVLREIIAAIRERYRVREDWGFRGAAGISVLFSGAPGVGKTMSATVIARALGLAIYEIDLSQIMSKWVGETEKNLAEVFDAAEPGHAVLLFNEADSLFGKRTQEVSTANDRFANLETNYLLQRLERFNGLSILTTNLGKSIDPAFRRRFGYDVQFAFPTAELRRELWRRAFPRRAHTCELDYRLLGERFELSGGYIKVATERAAFVAAGRGEPITTAILIATIERMYRERGKLSAVGRLE